MAAGSSTVSSVGEFKDVGKQTREQDIAYWMYQVINFKSCIFDMPANLRSSVATRIREDGYSIDRNGYIDWSSIEKAWK